MERDVSLRRVERTAVLICLVMAAIALIVSRGRPDSAIGVLAGGLLVGVSYHTLKAAVSGLVELMTPPAQPGLEPSPESSGRRPAASWILVKVALRYALLTLLAYVMIARLRLHPVGLLAGASSVVAAVSVEAIRLLIKKS